MPSNKHNVIRITTAITRAAFKAFSEQMAEFKNDSSRTIIVELFSEGGDAHAALAFAAMIRSSKTPVTVIAYGYVASAAVLILAAGHHRIMTQEAWVMVHEDSGTIEFESVVAMEREVKQYRGLENQWAALLEKFTGTPAEEWAIMHKETTHLSAEACKKLGLVDRIV